MQLLLKSNLYSTVGQRLTVVTEQGSKKATTVSRNTARNLRHCASKQPHRAHLPPLDASNDQIISTKLR